MIFISKSKTVRAKRVRPPISQMGRPSLKVAVTLRGHNESVAELGGQEYQPGCSLPGPALGFLQVRRGEARAALHPPVPDSCSEQHSDWPSSRTPRQSGAQVNWKPTRAAPAVLPGSSPLLPHGLSASWGHEQSLLIPILSSETIRIKAEAAKGTRTH